MLSIDDSREYLSALKGNTAMLRSIYPNIDADIRTLQEILGEVSPAKKPKLETLKAKLLAEFNHKGQSVLEDYITEGNFLAFKLLFEQVGTGKWYCSNLKYRVDPVDLMILALEEGNVDICTYLTEYVDPKTERYNTHESIFHKAVHAGSVDALKSICEAYQKHDPICFKRWVKGCARYPGRGPISPYQLALSYIGKENLALTKYRQHEEIAEYLKQFE